MRAMDRETLRQGIEVEIENMQAATAREAGWAAVDGLVSWTTSRGWVPPAPWVRLVAALLLGTLAALLGRRMKHGAALAFIGERLRRSAGRKARGALLKRMPPALRLFTAAALVALSAGRKRGTVDPARSPSPVPTNTRRTRMKPGLLPWVQTTHGWERRWLVDGVETIAATVEMGTRSQQYDQLWTACRPNGTDSVCTRQIGQGGESSDAAEVRARASADEVLERYLADATKTWYTVPNARATAE